jgi:hypothetical protein
VVEPEGGPGSGSDSSAAPLPAPLGEDAINPGGGGTQGGFRSARSKSAIEECECVHLLH